MHVAAILATVLAAAVVKHSVEIVGLAAGHARTVTVPLPDALKYGNARYSGRVVVLGAFPGSAGRKPRRSLVRIERAQPAVGGSEWQVAIRNDNPPGTAPVRLEVIATTTEPLPHR